MSITWHGPESLPTDSRRNITCWVQSNRKWVPREMRADTAVWLSGAGRILAWAENDDVLAHLMSTLPESVREEVGCE